MTQTTMDMSKIWRVSAFATLFSLFLSASDYSDAEEFVNSCVDHYDFKAEGRYTHEYHPFILKKAVGSLYQLKDRVKGEGLNLKGHVIIAGYEGEAIPSYYTDYNKMKINDEMSSKSKAGWSLRLHNRFGLMTGFLFKDFNEFSQRWFKKEEQVFQHVNPLSVELYNDNSGIFQKHAFKDSLEFMQDNQFALEKRLRKKDWDGIFKHLISFWDALYRTEMVLSDGQLAATQDILFSIDYGKYLLKSDLPILKYYIGGDITYPIEKSVKQGVDATKNAQDFVKIFIKRLKPIEDKKTVYIFNSFVDGVGKSTMLGNVKNWMKYGDNIEEYERVDNSSSQWAEVFQYSDKVYIADLPAQMSHFTYKPDGLVCVDIDTEKSEEEIRAAQRFVLEHQDDLLAEYNDIFDDVEEVYAKDGPLAESLNDQSKPFRTFLRNLVLLKKQKSNNWIPFEFAGEKYLFDFYTPSKIRIVRTLGKAASHGLKNIESEQMLFYDGVRFPLAYERFLDDLLSKIKNNGVENVVFVDFLSMYPRSSRENIRVNYLLQQISLLDSGFNQKFSLYKNFVNASELYSDLLNKYSCASMFSAFNAEVIIRYALYKLLEKFPSESTEGIKYAELTALIDDEIKEFLNDEKMCDLIRDKATLKFSAEKEHLYKVFGLTKEFVNIQQFSFELLHAFSDVMRWYFTDGVKNAKLNPLWGNLEGKITSKESEMICEGCVRDDQTIFPLEGGADFWVHYEFPLENRSDNYLSPFFQTLRANWYASLGNLLFLDEKFLVPPMLTKLGKYSPHDKYYERIYIGQKLLSEWEGEKPKTPRMFHVRPRANAPWGEFNRSSYCLNWDNSGTSSGIFAFGLPRIKKSKFSSSVSAIAKVVNEYQEEEGLDKVITANKLYKRLQRTSEWFDENRKLCQRAKQNGQYRPETFSNDMSVIGEKKMIFLAAPYMKEGARIFVKMLATLEMILKDRDGDIVVRKGHKKDFQAALKLIEQVTLPKYFGILFPEPLFDNYEEVEPTLPWDYFLD